MRWWLVVVLCSGCDLLFQLQHVDSRDAGEANDTVVEIDSTQPFMCDQDNISEGDFDGDGKPNSNDECPDLAAASPDDDLDGVGDDCDPRPQMAGDCLRVFQDFRTPELRCWTTTGWSYGCDSADTLGWCSPAGSHRTPLVYSGLAPLAFARMTGTIRTVSSQSAVVMLQAYAQAVDVTGDACGVVVESGYFSGVSGGWLNDTWQSGQSQPMAPAVSSSPAATIRAARTLIGTGTFCRASATAASMGTAQTNAAPDQIGQFAIHTRHTLFRIESVSGYSFGAGCD
ncbi:MAG TPA: hypothetical protein VIV11_35625 [Kofleriaceae bacterium]